MIILQETVPPLGKKEEIEQLQQMLNLEENLTSLSTNSQSRSVEN